MSERAIGYPTLISIVLTVTCRADGDRVGMIGPMISRGVGEGERRVRDVETIENKGNIVGKEKRG
jgi:hypothetical protein